MNVNASLIAKIDAVHLSHTKTIFSGNSFAIPAHARKLS